jgi:hypothetical protein
MQAAKVKRIAASAIMAVTLAVVALTVASPAARADQEPPVNVRGIANSPGMVTIYWDIYGDDHYGFLVEEQSVGFVNPADSSSKRPGAGEKNP